MTDLHIAEIPYENGGIRFRYARRMSEEGTRWIRHGLFQAYHQNGHLASEGHYSDGKEDGVWRDYHDNGLLAAEGEYRVGEQFGLLRYWTSEGVEEPSTD